jgi:hypothetical protein
VLSHRITLLNLDDRPFRCHVYLDIGVPIFDEKSKRFIGAVRAFADVFFPLFLRQ